MPKFGVTSQKEAELLTRMERCGVREGDLDESFIRSGGPGGQHVNRSATCVYIKHRPTGLEVKMQKSRSQALNRFYARRRICELIEEKSGDIVSAEEVKRDKLRKQKARRRKKSKKKYNEAGTGESDGSGNPSA
jgi:protein subunit release factor B